MGSLRKHILHQGPVIATIGGAAVQALRQQMTGVGKDAPSTPTEPVRATLSPRPQALIKDYVRHVGGDPSSYKKYVPPHLFPQWGFPIQAKTLKGIPYPLMKVLNGGCRVEVDGPLPIGEPLEVSATLESIDDNGRRAVLHQKVVTGTKSSPAAVTAHLYAIVPLGGGKKGKSNGKSNEAPKKKKEPARVPNVVDELARWNLKVDAGLDFAMLTGDFNPVHWVGPYAKAFGFKNTILHGFATMARAWEGLNKHLYSGDVDAIKMMDVQFTRPLVLPAKVGLYVDGHNLYVGTAPGGPAFLVGTFKTSK
jgi:acyl dehydratase